jgi:hypothetical protein
MAKNFDRCSVLIYNDDGSQLASAVILKHDASYNSIEISDIPELALDGQYDLFILSSPFPYTCRGKVMRSMTGKTIQLYKGKETENRKEKRYQVELQADIECLIYDHVAYKMLKKVPVSITNISKGGLCVKSTPNTMLVGDRFRIRIKIDKNTKLLDAHVINQRGYDTGLSDFGCRLVNKEDSP